MFLAERCHSFFSVSEITFPNIIKTLSHFAESETISLLIHSKEYLTRVLWGL